MLHSHDLESRSNQRLCLFIATDGHKTSSVNCRLPQNNGIVTRHLNQKKFARHVSDAAAHWAKRKRRGTEEWMTGKKNRQSAHKTGNGNVLTRREKYVYSTGLGR